MTRAPGRADEAGPPDRPDPLDPLDPLDPYDRDARVHPAVLVVGTLVATLVLVLLELPARPRLSLDPDPCSASCPTVADADRAAVVRGLGILACGAFLVACSLPAWRRAPRGSRVTPGATLPTALAAALLAATATLALIVAFWPLLLVLGGVATLLACSVVVAVGASWLGRALARSGLPGPVAGRVAWLAVLAAALAAGWVVVAEILFLSVGVGRWLADPAMGAAVASFVATWAGARWAGRGRGVAVAAAVVAVAITASLAWLVVITRSSEVDEARRTAADSTTPAVVEPPARPAPDPSLTTAPPRPASTTAPPRPATTGVPAARSCAPDDLDVRLVGWDAAMGSTSVGIRARNRSASACAVDGVPVLRLSQGGRELRLTYVPGSPGDRFLGGARRVGIAPGGTADAAVLWRGYRNAADETTPQTLTVAVFPGRPVVVPVDGPGGSVAPFDLVDGGRVEVSGWAAPTP